MYRIYVWGSQIICLYDIVKIKTLGFYTIYFYLIPLVYSLSLIMSLLDRMETKIGSVDNWRQDILRCLFYIRRSIYFMIVEIIRFLFGNKISLEDELELFDVYSKLSSQCEDLVHKYYEIWKQDDMSTYYNMSIGRMVYINGSDHNQFELVDVDPNEIKIGFGDFFFQTLSDIEF